MDLESFWKWERTYEDCLKIFRYCDGEKSPNDIVPEDVVPEQTFLSMYGEPSEKLRDETKNRLRKAFNQWIDAV